MARRKSHIAKRLQKMRGMTAYEKQLLIRLGELIDGVVNNRTPTNPRAAGRTRAQKKLPPPSVITHEPGVRSAKLTWPAVDSSILSHYAIKVIRMGNNDGTDGDSEDFVSFTNTFYFKGREGGFYKAYIRSVGRNETQSEVATIEFFVQEDVMLLEGTKNSFETIGAIVHEDYYFVENQKIFIWGAFTLDKLIGGADEGNHEVALRLWRSEKGQTIDDAVLLEEITMFAASESATCLAIDALGGGIERPAILPPVNGTQSYTRGTTFETSQSVMFSPIIVESTLANREHTFYLTAVGRELENDVISLSLTIWSGNTGESFQVPSDPFVPEPGIVQAYEKCVAFKWALGSSFPWAPTAGFTTEYMNGKVPENFRSIGTSWTFCAWILLRYIPEEQVIFDMCSPWLGVNQNANGQNRNRFRMIVRNQATIQPNRNTLRTIITVAGDTSDSAVAADEGQWVHDSIWNTTLAGAQNANANVFGNYFDQSAGANVWQGGTRLWTFISITYNVVDGITVFANGLPVTSGISVNTTAGLSPDMTVDNGPYHVMWGAYISTATYLNGEIRNPTAVGNRQGGYRIYAAGFWDKNLPQIELLALYNGSFGSLLHWRNPQPIAGYDSFANLVHYWQFAALDESIELVARDTGYNPLGSGGSDGDIDCSNEDRIGPDFSIDNNVINNFPPHFTIF